MKANGSAGSFWKHGFRDPATLMLSGGVFLGVALGWLLVALLGAHLVTGSLVSGAALFALCGEVICRVAKKSSSRAQAELTHRELRKA